ncbi:MAG: hypothetical protein A2X86_05615 [Bdellovibrionales bacterium GWA2_49_15]|nr:MAG: hypothetical protein A2X86_05615 [Bdellovibrionales bacterium GWA2_49_15]
MDDIWFMKLALEQAEMAYRLNEVPVGALVVSAEGKVLSSRFNTKEQDFDPCGHAEILAIREAAQREKAWRLVGCSVYVTLEPCIMCLAAMGQARVGQLIFGAYDPKGGALGLGYRVHADTRLNHRFAIKGGLLEFDCSKILSQFFREQRSFYR